MPDRLNHRHDGQMITMYAPIFREELEKLERRGKAHDPEAVKLRETLARIDRAQNQLSLSEDRECYAAAAE